VHAVHDAWLPELYVPAEHVVHATEPAAAAWPAAHVAITPFGHAEPAGHCEQLDAPEPQ
jgi:hypothetical protein